MQSTQESVLEEFMQNSFGAQFLYIPKKFFKGTAPKEPADLAWVANDIAILFYLRSSKEALADQVLHNRKQAAGFHRLWSTNQVRYALRGRNRFGDECFMPYSSLRTYLSILVVSEKCGIHFAPALTEKIANAVVVIPEALLHWLAEFGGTIVDLLFLVDAATAGTISDGTDVASSSFDGLTALVAKYTSESLSKADPERRYLAGKARHDLVFLSEHLSKMRLPASTAGMVEGADARKEISGIFGDFTLTEYASLAVAAETAIQASEPPLFKKWVIIKLQRIYYSFVIGTMNLGSKNVVEVTDAVLKASRDDAGVIDSIAVVYGNVLNANEFRVPLMVTLPPVLPRKHYDVLIEKIIDSSKSGAVGAQK